MCECVCGWVGGWVGEWAKDAVTKGNGRDVVPTVKGRQVGP